MAPRHAVAIPETAADTIRSMLPAGFLWIPRYQYAQGELALEVDGALWAAQLMRRVDGDWIASLAPYAVTLGPRRIRACSSFDAGKAGIEAWACRHETLLREQALLCWRNRAPAVRLAAGRGSDGRLLPARDAVRDKGAALLTRLPGSPPARSASQPWPLAKALCA